LCDWSSAVGSPDLQPPLLRRAPPLHRADDDALHLLQPEALRDVVGHGLHDDAGLPAPPAPIVEEVLGRAEGGVGGDGEADADVAARGRKYLRVDADQLARRADERAARVAL